MLRPALLTPLFDALPIGIVVLDRRGDVVVYNAHEERLAGRRRERVLGRAFFEEIAPCMDIRELAGAFHDKIDSHALDERVEIEFSFPHAEGPRAVACRLLSFVAEAEPYGMLLVEDVSMRRAIEELKTNLSNLLVHDLKNPLAVVLANVDLVKRSLEKLDPSHVPSRVIPSLVAARAAGTRLNAMIVDLLDLTRLQTGTMPVKHQIVDVGALLAEATHALRASAEQNGRELVLDAPEQLDMEVDPNLFRRILDNLVDNALRHTPAGTCVTVRARVEGEQLAVDVVDEGPGVPAHLRDKIFDPYVSTESRVTASANRGLGLSFVQLAVRAHGGDVTVHDRKPRGAVFHVTLPLSTPRLGESTPMPAARD